MVHRFSPTTRYENKVVGGDNGYSTLYRDVARGGTFSLGLSRDQAKRLDPTASSTTSPSLYEVSGNTAVAPELAPAPAPLVTGLSPGVSASHLTSPMATAAPQPVVGGLRLSLATDRFPPNPFVGPNGLASRLNGSIDLGPSQVSASLSGLQPLPQGFALTPWLIADLAIPSDLDPQDLALLPRVSPEFNLPGECFTVDGQACNIGRNDVRSWNAVGVAVRPGTLTVSPEGSCNGQWAWSDDWNWALHPMSLLGSGGSLNAAVPSGVAMNVLTDLFLRPATVFPELPLQQQFAQRLMAIWQRHLSLWDKNGDGTITPEEVAGAAGAFLGPEQFRRAALTLEPIGQRSTPHLLPTQQACLAVGLP